MIELARHESRVYSFWENGTENFYFKASPGEINDLIRMFSATRLRDHALWIKAAENRDTSITDDKYKYNVNLHYMGGISLGMSRREASPKTFEPTLTVYVDPGADQAFWKQIVLPDNIVLENEVANCPLKGRATKPERKVWHAQVQFDDATPAVDFEGGLNTKVTLWEKGVEQEIKLGRISHKGLFRAAFSDKEMADLKTGHTWLTLTVGNWLTEARRDHPKLSLDHLELDRTKVQPVRIHKPGFYYGRILFEDGSPPILAPAPWPGAKIMVDFSYAGNAYVDSEGYFKVHFSDGQYEALRSGKTRKNIYIPSYKENNTSAALFAFSVSKLSRNKEEAGVVKIPDPIP